MDGTENTETTSQETGGEPWASVLEQIPSQFHGDVGPALKTWATDYKNQIESPYSAWKPFIEQKIDPGQVQSAWGLAAALEQDPVGTIKTIRQYYEGNGYKFEDAVANATNPQTAQPQATNADLSDLDPRIVQQFEEIKKQNEIMAQVLLKENEQKRAQQEDARVAQEFSALHEKMTKKHGRDFNEQFVGGLALATGMSLEQAAEAYYQEIQNSAVALQRPAPSVLGTGGGLPSNRPNIRQMGEQEFKSYATDFVRSFMRNGGS